MTERRWPPAAWGAAGVLFVVLATANGGGYRYGASDQAFYIPVVLRALTPAAFPRDAGLIDAQGSLMIVDEMAAALVRVSGLSLEAVFLGGYLLSMALVWTALVLIGSRLCSTPWGTAALAAAFTLRHRIPGTSANSFEPYFYPRMLAFAIGLLALAAVLRHRLGVAVLLIGAAAAIHVTVGVFFATVVGVAAAILDRRARRLLLWAAPVAALGGALALARGPLTAAFERMDAPWLAAVASKDSLFPADWPAWVWAANLGLPCVLWWAHRRRVARGDAREEDRAVVWGGLALVGLFAATLPLVAAHWALPTQLQISRVFWILDFLAVLYLLALVTPAGAARRARLVAAVLLVASAARGAYVMLVEFDDRPLFRVRLAETPWHDAMRWLSRQPVDVHVLADPGHAWKYGTSVRVAAGRDVFLEDTKDTALAIYSREIALRVNERAHAIGSFDTLSAERAQELAWRYDLDVLVTEQRLLLPVAYQNRQFVVYRIGTGRESITGNDEPAPGTRTRTQDPGAGN